MIRSQPKRSFLTTAKRMVNAWEDSVITFMGVILRLTFAQPKEVKRLVGHAWDKSAFPGFSKVRLCNFTEERWSGRRGSNSQLSAWEAKVGQHVSVECFKLKDGAKMG